MLLRPGPERARLNALCACTHKRVPSFGCCGRKCMCRLPRSRVPGVVGVLNLCSYVLMCWRAASRGLKYPLGRLRSRSRDTHAPRSVHTLGMVQSHGRLQQTHGAVSDPQANTDGCYTEQYEYGGGCRGAWSRAQLHMSGVHGPPVSKHGVLSLSTDARSTPQHCGENAYMLQRGRRTRHNSTQRRATAHRIHHDRTHHRQLGRLHVAVVAAQ